MDVNQPINVFHSKLKESQSQFANVENELAKTIRKTSGNESFKKSIDQVINGYETQTELDGQEMIEFLLGKSETQVADEAAEPNQILNKIAQNFDASKASSFDVIPHTNALFFLKYL